MKVVVSLVHLNNAENITFVQKSEKCHKTIDKAEDDQVPSGGTVSRACGNKCDDTGSQMNHIVDVINLEPEQGIAGIEPEESHHHEYDSKHPGNRNNSLFHRKIIKNRIIPILSHWRELQQDFVDGFGVYSVGNYAALLFEAASAFPAGAE